MITFKVINNRDLKINCSPDFLKILRETLSVKNPAAFSKKRFVSDRIYAITPTGVFKSGLLSEIIKILNIYDQKYEISDEIKNDSGLDSKFEFFDGFKYKLRDYQKKALQSALCKKTGVIVLGTGGGKTLLTAAIIQNCRKILKNPDAKCLITVPTLQLVTQTHDDFIEYGLTDVSKWSGKEKFQSNSKIVVASTSILNSEKTDLSVLSDFDIYIGDECHTFNRGNKILTIFKFLNPKFKYGLTGSMPQNMIDYWTVLGFFGEKLYEKKTKELEDEKYLTPFKIYILNIQHKGLNIPYVKNNPIESYQNEIEVLNKTERRNDILRKLALRLTGNTIIMVDRLDLGQTLLNLIKEKKEKCYFIQGSTDLDDREKIKAILTKEDGVIVIAMSKIFSTGINIPNLHNIIFAQIGKSKIKIIQSIGRSLRLHKNKKFSKIFDIADNTLYGSKHKNERIKIYSQEKYEFEEIKI